MSQKTIVVSFVGKGKVLDDSYRYDQTTYDFAGKQIQASIFCNAILKSQIYAIDEYILIGTPTSSWSALLENDNLPLKAQIEKQVESSGIEEKSLVHLQQALQKKWQLSFKCYICPEILCEKNILETMYNYFVWISPQEYFDAKIILDITHGFRSMSTLIMSAIQFRDTLSPHSTYLEIIYGEFNRGKVAPVRKLDLLWKGVKIAKAAQLFFDKFDSSLLSAELQKFWPEGAKAIQNLSITIQANLILRLDYDLDTLKKSFSLYKKEQSPLWSQPIIENTEQLYLKLATPKNRYQRILALAKLFQERGLLGQAIVALQLSYETFLFFYFNEPENVDGRKRYQKARTLRKNFENKLDLNDTNQIKKLHHLRNSIAHGGNTIEGIKNLHDEFEQYHLYLTKLYNNFS